MCGIIGVYSLKEDAGQYSSCLEQAIKQLSNRGPDNNGNYIHKKVGLGHTRLSIIDISQAGAQPMQDNTGRFTIVFNGEIYNHIELRKELETAGVQFKSHSDTEVLLHLYIKEGRSCFQKLNGFFAFGIYDSLEESLFIARDRLGIKPLYYYKDDERILFASEMKALFSFPIKKELDYSSLLLYLQLNYIPAPSSIFKHVKKLNKGELLEIRNGIIEKQTYYTIARNRTNGSVPTYENAKTELVQKLETSVQHRLIADVPLGAFLSGGIDSSIIVGLASRHTDKLSTFSVGYSDEPYFDETEYANLVAKKFNTNHTVFSLSNKELYDHLFDILDYIDEPFADSSAIAVYILSRKTRSKVKVALSGDGADELFAGYNKHLAEYRANNNYFMNLMVKANQPLFAFFPKSRNTALGNKVRQLDRYVEGLRLPNAERYWRWCSFINEKEALGILNEEAEAAESEYYQRKQSFLTVFRNHNLNDTLHADMNLVLPNDMLTKVDLMSMANSLEVRVPFLDHEVVNFVTSLPAEFKLYRGFRKRILKDAFRDMLPNELYNRPKRGFEVPLLKWFKNELHSLIENDLLSERLIRSQNIFNWTYIQGLKQKLFSKNPQEVQAQIWGLIVFQYWWKKYMT